MTIAAKRHYHWLVALIVFLEITVFGGIINSFVIYTVPVIEDLGVNYGSFSVANLPYSIVAFLSSMVVGVLLHSFGYKKLTTVCLLISASGMLLMSCSHDLVVFGISRAMFGIGYGACFTAGAVFIIKSWFLRHQGLILGIVTMASGIGGSLMSTILTKIIVRTGWRIAALCSGALLILIAIFYLLIRNHPKELGLKKFGENPKKEASARLHNPNEQWIGFPRQVILRRPLLYLTCLAVTLSSISVLMTSTTIVPYYQDTGYSATAASGYNSILMLVLAAAKLAAGWFSDRYGATRLTFLCLICAALGHFMITSFTSPAISYISVAIFSVGLCMTSICIPLMTVPLFGYMGSLEINSFVLAMPSLAMILATPLANFARDHFGSYVPAYRVAFITDVLLIAVFIVIFAMAGQDRKRYEAK